MKIRLLFKITLLCIVLIILQILIVIGLKNVFNIEAKYGTELVFFSLDLSFLIIIFIAIKIWKVNIRELFKKVSLKHLILLFFLGSLIMLIYPITNIPNLIDYIATGKTGIMLPLDDVFSQKNTKVYHVVRTLVLMPFLEEILYRGIIQKKLQEHFSFIWAILISSILFAIVHMDFQQSITVFFSSLLIGYIYYRSKNLTAVVLLHCFVNVGFLFFRIEYQEGINYSVLFYHFSLIVLLIFIAKMYPKTHHNGN